MNHHLQARLVGSFDAFEHDALGNHLLEKQPAGVGRIIIRLEEVGGGRTEAAVGKAFQRPNAERVAAEGGAHAGFGQHLP